MSRKRKVVIFVIIALVVIVGGAIAKGRGGSKKGDVTSVKVEKPSVGELTEFVSAPGEIDARKKVEISAKVSARILEMPVKAGDTVTCGNPKADPPIPATVLIRLDSKDLQSELNNAKANYMAQQSQLTVQKEQLTSQKNELRRTEVNLQQALKDFERQKGLLASHDVSESDCEKAKLNLDVAEFQKTAAEQSVKGAEGQIQVITHQLEAAKSRIDKAEDALSCTTIEAPIDGTVTKVNAEVGDVVVYGTMNNAGTVIMEVADLSQMIVAAQADEMEVSKIKVGQKAKIHIQAYPEITFNGEVVSTALAQSITNQYGGVKFYRTEVLIDPNGKTICAGFNADVDIETKTYKDVMKVASQTILSREVESLPKEAKDKLTADQKRKTYATVVYKLVDGKAVVVPVKMGASDMTHTIVESGLSVDDKVVVGPFKVLEKIKHGDLLKEEEEKSKKTTTAKDNSPAKDKK
jgi:HlyD family secretion protein